MQDKMKKIAIFSACFLLFSQCELSGGKPSHETPATDESSRVSVEIFAADGCCVDDSFCQDGLWCNGHELCDCWGECLEGLPPGCSDSENCVVCDDLNLCTVDSCNEALDRCDHVPIGNCCDTAADCDDLNPCTTHACNGNVCSDTVLPDGTACGAGSTECYQAQCQAGVCLEVVNTGAPCTFSANACFDPGQCRADGLCGPVLHPPANDTCAGAEAVALSAAGTGSASGSTVCAVDDYTGSCGGATNADVVYSIAYTVSATLFQLYSQNVVVDADFNSVLFARTTCTSDLTQVACNDDCLSNPVLNCGLYGLAPTDSGITIGPGPAGSSQAYSIIVDGRGGAPGLFMLSVDRSAHANNPCQFGRDNVRVVNATGGGEYRGNTNGYVNDFMDAASIWVKSPCHGAENASFDWPARAWFKLAPAADTTYRIETDETVPAAWFDTVIDVYDNTLVTGCNGVRTYVACGYIAGRNLSTVVDNLLVPAGSTYLVGISSYARPVGGDYLVRFTIL